MSDFLLSTPTEATMSFSGHGASYMTVSELANRLGVHRNTVIYWISSEQIAATRAGVAKRSPYIIPIEEANRIINELRENDKS